MKKRYHIVKREKLHCVKHSSTMVHSYHVGLGPRVVSQTPPNPTSKAFLRQCIQKREKSIGASKRVNQKGSSKGILIQRLHKISKMLHMSHRVVHSNRASKDAKCVQRNQHELYVDENLHCLVIIGKVYTLGLTIHYRTMDEDKVQDANGQISMPTKEIKMEFNRSKKDVWPKRSKSQLDPLQCLWMLQLDAKIEDWNSTIPFYICQKDVLEVCTGDDMLCISIIQLWLMQSTRNKPIEFHTYLQKRLQEGRNKTKLWKEVIGWQVGTHHKYITTWIHPFYQRQPRSFERGYYVMKHMFNIVSANVFDSWNEYQRQPRSFECGYYVMKHMFNIVSTNVFDSWNK
ncbi:hypothetical protein CR513_20791, partial [Mucuna pruriens]